MSFPTYIRVRDLSTGDEFNIIDSAFDPHEVELVDEPAVNADGTLNPPKHADQPAGDEGSYSSLLVADLQAEIDRRNADRSEDDAIVPAGAKKADLVAALEADDNA